LLLGEHGNGQVVRQSQLPERFQCSAQGRDHVILEAVANHLPELLPFATSTLSGPSDLQFGDLTLQSEEGTQQGDPLGPLYFCLAIVELLKSMGSELVLAYLDDITLGDDAETVLNDFLQLDEAASRELKCDV